MNRAARRAAAAQAAKDYEREINCGCHGRSAWTGQVICTACSAVWHLNHGHEPPTHGVCTCGAALLGDTGTARPICPDCYVANAPGAALS